MRRAGLALGFCLLLAVPAAAAEAAPQTTLHLRQVASRNVTRDRLTVDLRIEAQGADLRQVQAEVNRRMTAALAKAKAARGVEAASGSYTTYRLGETGPDGKPQSPESWRAAQDLTLSGGDFAAVLGLAGTLQADGLAIASMRFGVSPETLHREEGALTRQALAGLEARAAGIANALGLKVAGIRDLTVGNAETEGAPFPMAMAARAGAAPPPAVAAGNSTVSVTVTADILLAPRP